MWRSWSCLCYCQNRPAGDPRGACERLVPASAMLVTHDIKGVSHTLLSNFVNNRMQCTEIGTFKSSYKRISYGVPQVSVISPLLFLIYINDITHASSFHTTLFADDISFHMSNDHWRRAKKLSLNNKTNYMLLNFQKYNLTSFKVSINNYNISSKIAWNT